LPVPPPNCADSVSDVPSTSQVDHRSVAILGIETICVYGAWWYSYGVLLDPIIEDTGWSETTLAGSFSLGALLIGIGSIFGGRLLDRFGSRPVFLISAISGGACLAVASAAQSEAAFFLSSAGAQGAFGALGFYHVTMAAAVRSSPLAPTRAIAVLTIWGALASAIYLPVAAYLVNSMDWRWAVRVLGLSAVAALVLAAFGAAVPPAVSERKRPSLRSVMSQTWQPGSRRGFTIAVALIGTSTTTLFVYQVPVMVAAGLPLTTAATAAAVRGFAQLGGRVPLGPLIGRIGSSGALIVSMITLTAGSLILTVAGTLPLALAFAAVAGFGIGAWSPLQGIRAAELFDGDTIGTTLGFYTTVFSTAGAIGPVAAGVMVERTGDRRWGAVIAAMAAAAALIAFLYSQRGSIRGAEETYAERGDA